MRSIEETINALKNGEYDDKLTYLYSCDKNDVKKYSDRYIDVINAILLCSPLRVVLKSEAITQTTNMVAYLQEVLILMLYLQHDQTARILFVFNQETIRLM